MMAILSAGKFPGMGFPITTGTLRADALAGLLGAVLSLPQGIAFGTLAGMPPEYGIYTAVVPCITPLCSAPATTWSPVPPTPTRWRCSRL
jgi:hypothetical protein